jgi:hypothetical protein
LTSPTNSEEKRTMRSNYLKTLKTAVRLAGVLLLGAGLAVAQQQVNLTAGPTTVTLPDGSVVPMWGYFCGTAVSGSTATCAALNPASVGTTVSTWSPVVITVPTGQTLQINLTNSLAIASGSGFNNIPTSLTIVGQLGGGLGTPGTGCTGGATCTPSPTHSGMGTTWPIAGPPPGWNPPPQGARVQSFGTEVLPGAAAPALTWTAARPGTYLLESGTHPSIQGPMGLYGIVVVTTAPAAGAAGCAYPGATTGTCAVSYDAEVPLLFSEIDPVQNNKVSTAVSTAGFSETAVWSGQPGGCGNPASATYNTCYPPAVNYTPLYYLINGLAFDKTQNTPTSLTKPSLFPTTPATGLTASTQKVLVRLVNAGSRMHVPSIVGSLTTPAIVPTGTTATAAAGFSLVAEDGNPLPGVSRVQSEVFMAAGKTYDVMIDVPAAGGTALPVFDRELSLSGNSIGRDSGMLGYISVNGAGMPAAPGLTAAVAMPDTYNSVVPCTAPAPCNGVTVSDPGKGVIANDTNVYGVQLLAAPTGGTVTLNANGTFKYVQTAGTTSDSFSYCANGSVTAGVCSSGITATVTLGAATVEAAGGITCGPSTYSSNAATALSIKPPGILSVCKDGAGYPLTVASSTGNAPVPTAGLTLSVDANGGFNASVAAAGTYSFTFKAQNSQGTVAAATATVTLTFPTANGPLVTVVDGQDKTTRITDYRWIIEEDRTFYINPACTTNPPPAGCPSGVVPTFGTNFHTSYMPVIAAGCTGPLSCESGQTLLGVAAVCDVGNGVCRTGASQQATLDPSAVHLDPTKRYYISVLPGDAGNPFGNGYGGSPVCTSSGGISTPSATCGHGMGGSPIACIPTAPAVSCASTGTFPAVTILSQPAPYPSAKLSVFVFEDDFPLNGEQDGGGGVDVLSPNEPGLGNFNIKLFDDAGGTGDATGQMTYDMFNMPLSNSLAGTIDPATGLDACPISGQVTQNVLHGDGSQKGITGEIVTCPKFESDNQTLSPIAGQAVVANLMPGRYGVVATPGADRIARGEEWLQTNTLDGQKAHDSFLRIGEPSFFQEYGPAGYHVSIGFANPQIINDRKAFVCNGTDPNISGSNCTNSVTGLVTTERMSRTPDQRLYSSGDNTSFGFTQCYVSFGDADGEDFAFTKCASDGSFTLSGLPDGDWRVTVFDQWNDILVDGLSTPVRLANGATQNLGELAMNQWQANIYTTSFFDMNGNGIQDALENGLTLVSTNNRFRDGSYSNFNNTDLAGNAGFNEIFPLFSWYVIESDSTRYKTTGIHVVYDAGGPADGSSACTASTIGCGSSSIASMLANTFEQAPLPTSPNLRVPGALYCDNADCTGSNSQTLANPSTGRIDPPFWFGTEGWQGFSGQNQFVQFGKKPYCAGTGTAPSQCGATAPATAAENGGIRGEVIYASTRPFDDPTLLIHTSWTPDVPGVTVNLYQEGTASDGTQSLTLVDSTKTSSWDDWAQGFRTDGIPNMNCPGQLPAPAGTTPGDLFFFSLANQPMWLDQYNNGGIPAHTIPLASQFKCYDGMHNWNQVQPAPYDGMYVFPSVVALDPNTGKPTGTGSTNGVAGSVAGSNCTICVPNPDTTDTYRSGTAMLPAGKYVVEILVPPGYELVKEEDKNILIGDNYIAPVNQQFAGLGNIFIMPDQAEIDSFYNANNPQNPTQTLGRFTYPNGEGDTGSVEIFWPCVGAMRTVPDFISLFPQSGEVSPFAGATRPLCDRKEVTLTDQTSALAKFWIFSSTHTAAHYTGVITDDYTSEFDPFSPTFGEKFSPPDLPISIKDWSGTEISRTYADHWGSYTGLTYSTWEVNPPNPTGYAPTMMVTCMNDPGPIVDHRATIVDSTGTTVPNPNFNQLVTDPLYNPQYSQFCYEIPFMPGQTQYMDTPVVPTSAFAGAGYNNPDCAYPNAMPAIKEVDGDGVGPYLSATGALRLTITAQGDQVVPNNAYTGPAANSAPYNAKTTLRHYGFGPTAGLPGGCTNGNPNAACPNVTVGGVPLHGVTWSDTTITGTVQQPAIPACKIQQQAVYGGSAAQCGELVITAANGLQSIDAVTVTIGGKAPTHVAASASVQAAIDAADPGDLLMIDPGTHNEILIMWKPVRLQGVGAASSIINANTHPAGKLDNWRARVNCLFGLGLDGSPKTWNSSCGTSLFGAAVGFQPSTNNPQIDRLPLEATVGWDASLNGNLAELLQEPSLMGALEGAGITVLSKGVFFPSDPFDPTLLAGFPDGTILFNASNTATYCPTNATSGNYTSNFWCNPASIDGLTITNSSQGGGGIFVHGWGHNIQIANNRVHNNAGTLGGGINVGQGEFPGAYLLGGTTNASPGSCTPTASFGTNLPNSQQPYCFDLNVNVHNNAVSLNSSTGDELFSATPAGAGGVNFCTGSDYYQFNYNWVCGNLSTGDGGGFGHLGFSYFGDIDHNTFLFNQSTNPTIQSNGGAIIVMGAPDVDPTCGTQTDQDCVPPAGSVGPSDGTGPGLVINANLIMGNQAESGTGGGIALQAVNGSDIISFPDGAGVCSDPSLTSCNWNSVTLTNNIIVNNVAGWDGAGASFRDTLAANFVNNTVISNDSTASSGVLFDTIGAPLASTGGSNCYQSGPTGANTASCPQVAGLVSIQNSAVLAANLSPLTVTCPPGHGTTGSNGSCKAYSVPLLDNDLFWQNRSFQVGVGAYGTGTLNQQHLVSLFNAGFSGTGTGSAAATQASTGACPAGSSYWDIGVRGDTGPGNHNGGSLSPNYSFVGSNNYGGTNSTADPTVVHQYCNGSRVPPEAHCVSATGTSIPCGWQVPPGIADATVPNPVFNLTPSATVDEGNNWVNIAWGPLAETGPLTQGSGTTAGTKLGNYALAGGPAVGYIPSSAGTAYTVAPTFDFVGTNRKANGSVDAGAIEFTGAGTTTAILSVTPTSLTFPSTRTGTTSATQNLTLSNSGTAGATTISITVSAPFTRVNTAPFPAGAGNCGTTLSAGANCTIKVAFAPTAVGPAGGTVTITANVPVTGSAVTLAGTGLANAVVAFSAPSPSMVTTPATTAVKNSTITVTNNGTGALTLTAAPSIAKLSGGANTGPFTITGGSCVNGAVVNPGLTCTIAVRYTPNTTGSIGTATGNVTLTDTGAATATQTSATFSAN